MKKVISISLLCIMLMSVFLTGCVPKSTNEGSTSGSKKITLAVGNWPSDPKDQNLPKMNKFKEEFEKKYKDITIKADTYGYDTNTFVPKAESGQLPNLFVTWFTEPQKIIDAGYAADITEYMNKYGFDKALNPDMLKICSKDNKIYGIPTGGYYVGIWINMNIFKKAGLVDSNGLPKYPKTYDELAQDAQLIREKTGKSGFFFPTTNNQGGWLFLNIAWSYGADFEQEVDGKWKAVFNSPEAVEALQYLKDLKWKYNGLQSNILTDVNEMFKLFGTDQVGMSFGSKDWVNGTIDKYKISKDNFAVCSLPAGPKGRFSQMGGGLNMISKNSTPEQIDAAFKWLEFTGFSPKLSEDGLNNMETSYKNDKEKGHAVGPYVLPVWVNKERSDAEQKVRDKYTNVDMKLWEDYMKNEGVTIKPEPSYNCQELYKRLDSVVQAVLTNKNSDPKDLLNKAAADFQRDYLDKINK
ncbi:MAG: sugar ABC transporter substrate-binding protein [Clostridiales bacterium]|nr:sugar ABC transporter substrate-binding protein [Clostridiales bacterium]